MADPKSSSETVKTMENQASLTFGWPVVVNYAVDKINQLLEVTYKHEPQNKIKELTFDITFCDTENEKHTIHYELKLGAPFIQLNQDSTCNLTFPIIGGTAEVDDAGKSTVPSGVYTLVLSNVELTHDGQDGFVVDLPASKGLAAEIRKSSKGSVLSLIDNYTDSMAKAIKQLFQSDSYKNVRVEPQRQISSIAFDVTWSDNDDDDDDDDPKKYTNHYDLNLGAPLLQFNPRSAKGPSCNLTFKIVSGTAERVGSSKGKKDVPPNVYTLVLSNLKLSSAKGYWDSSTKDYSDPFVFRDHDTKQGCVLIDLPASKDLAVELSKSKEASSSKFSYFDNHMPDMEKSIKSLLHSDGVYKNIRYEIARVIPKAADGEYQLQPQSFLFDAFLRSDTPKPDDPGVLTLFIQTKGAEKGKQNELVTAWENQWRVTLKCSPIPEGKTASIIFSREMIYKNAIQPALKAKGYSEKRIDGGQTVKMEINPKIHVHSDRWSQTTGNVVRSRDEIDLDLPPFQLELTERDPSGGGVISWKFSYTYGWGYFVTTKNGTGYSTSGSVTVTNEIAGKFQKGYLDDHNLVVGCDVSASDWKVTAKADDKSFWEKLLGGSTDLPDWAKVKVGLPRFQFTFANVNFFLTTNLLFPLDKQVINVNNSGLHIPSDFYLVGNVVDK